LNKKIKDKNMNGWITLLSSENYLPAVLILNQTMQNVKSKYPLIVGITEDIYSDKIITILHKYNIITEKIEKTSYAKEVVEKYSNHSVLNTASKIMLFSLDKYEKLIYIDADVYVKENMDELFDNYEDGSILCYPYDKEDNK
jgi:alpha-N-acetylglucosamine transferase